MAPRPLIHQKPPTDALIWCCLQNFTPDFLAESIYRQNPQKYKRIFSSTASLTSTLQKFLNFEYLAEKHSPSRHFRSAALCTTLGSATSSSQQSSLFTLSATTSCSSIPPSISLLSFQLPSPRHSSVAFYSTSSSSSSSDNKQIDAETSPSSPSLQNATFDDLILLLKSDSNYNQRERVTQLIDHFLDSPDTRLKQSVLQTRNSIYKYLVNSKSPLRLKLVDKIIKANKPQPITKLDFATKLKCIIDLSPQNITDTLVESLHLFNSKTVFEFLSTTIKYLRKSNDTSISSTIYSKPRFIIKLYYSIIFKLYGTLRLLDTDLHRMERSLLTEIVINEEPQQLTQTIRSLMSEDKELVSILTSTAISVSYAAYKFDTVIDLWNVKVEQGTETTYDLFKTMSAYLKKKKSNEALSIYEQHPELHADWLFDVVLKTYALKKDWSGMQRIFESLFGRGELPNVEHYRIVMDAISKIANADIVEMMFNNMLSRGLQPTTNIYNAVIFSYYSKGDLDGVLKSFEMLEKSDRVPNDHSYNILTMMFRDKKDITSAIGVIQKMLDKGLPVPRIILTTIISLCANKRDTLNAERVFNWIYELGNHPDLHSYNALLNCYVESKASEKADQLIEKMQRLKIPLRLDTMTIMMKHYIFTKNWNAFEKLLDQKLELNFEFDDKFYSLVLLYFQARKNIPMATKVIEELALHNEATIIHYTILMTMHLKAKNYREVIDIYNSLEALKLSPTFQTSAVFLSAMSRLSTTIPELKTPALKIMNEFLDDKTSIDLTSDYTPRNAIHPSLARVALKQTTLVTDPEDPEQITAAANSDNIEEILKKLELQAGSTKDASVNDVIVLRQVLLGYGRARDWDNFNKYWTKFFSQLRKQFVPYETTENGEAAIVNKLPGRNTRDNDSIIRYKLFQMVAFGEHTSIASLFNQLQELGFSWSNKLLNETVVLLLGSDNSLKDAFRLANTHLMPFELRRSKWKPVFKKKLISNVEYMRKVGQYSIQQTTRHALCKALQRLVNNEMEIISKQQQALNGYTSNNNGNSPQQQPDSVTVEEALRSLQSQMALIIPYVYKRVLGKPLNMQCGQVDFKSSQDQQLTESNNVVAQNQKNQQNFNDSRDSLVNNTDR